MTDDTERAHNEGSDFHREGSDTNHKSTIDQIIKFADATVAEVTRVGKTAMTSENAPKLAAGAVVGGVAGAILPFISLPLGAIAGLGYVAYRAAQKDR